MPTDDSPKVGKLSRAERKQRGKEARRTTPVEALAEHNSTGRDPIDLLETQAATRVRELIPLRYGRMSASAFAFYRGSALVMADDLSRSPRTDLRTQLCGDAHMSNFGMYATPERKLVFDINDFDETYPGPFEWDVKRLVASLAVAAAGNDFSTKQRRRITQACAREYRETMARQARAGNLAVYYTHVDTGTGFDGLYKRGDSAMKKRINAALKKAKTRDSLQALSKLTELVDGKRRIISTPPLVVPLEELVSGDKLAAVNEELRSRLRLYRETLAWDRRLLLDQFDMIEVARKVVGVGSVGTLAWIVLMEGVDNGDPLFLQVKQAQPSVLKAYVDGPSIEHEGQRVVHGQRLLQATSDIFLGYQKNLETDLAPRDFYYVRQLRDGKGSVVVEEQPPEGMLLYGQLCGRVLAYAHARSGDRVAIAGYIGSSSRFEEALTEFSESYLKQTLLDHSKLVKAIADNRITAQADV